MLFPLLAEKIYIHQIVYDEIMMSQNVKNQINLLISEQKMFIVKETCLNKTEQQVYNQTWNLLAQRMMNPKQPRKNRGEVASLSFAKTKSIPIFATDEMDLQPIIDAILNTGIDDIKCLRIIDIIKQIKNNEFPTLKRKDARLIWLIARKKKEIFDNEIWPL